MSENLHKRPQMERLALAEVLLMSVWQEIQDGKIEGGLLQTAVHCQTEVNRIVWKLNEIAWMPLPESPKEET